MQELLLKAERSRSLIDAARSQFIIHCYISASPENCSEATGGEKKATAENQNKRQKRKQAAIKSQQSHPDVYHAFKRICIQHV